VNQQHNGSGDKPSSQDIQDGDRVRRNPGDFRRHLASLHRRPGKGSCGSTDAFGAWLNAKEASFQEALSDARAQREREGVLAADWSTSGGVAVTSGSVARRGLNKLELFREEAVGDASYYGSTEQQVQDASAVGAKVLRQFGYCDLLWGHMTGYFGLEGQERRAVPLDYLESDYEQEHYDRLVELFRYLDQNNLKVVFTFMTLGGGATGEDQEFEQPRFRDPLGEYQTGGTDDSNMLALGWSEDHAGNTVRDAWGNVHSFTYMLDPSTPASHVEFSLYRTWYLGTLDVRSPYKRAYLGHIAESMALKLNAAADAAGVVLSSVVEGIEIFNEPEVRNVTLRGNTSTVLGAGYWAKAWAEVAIRFRQALGDEVKLFGPSLAGYSLDMRNSSRHSRNWKLNWYLYFLIDVDDCLGSDWSIGDLMAGMDYHWYHRAVGGVVHMASLARDVQLLAELFRWMGVSSPEISVFETGVSVDGDYDPTTDGEWFQAHDIWRRYSAALVGSCSIAGWHSWMSLAGEGAQFRGMGLRNDIEIEMPVGAYPRPSYGAYWTTTDLAGAVQRSQLLLPDIDVVPNANAFLDLELEGAMDCVVAVEMEMVSPGRYLYVLLIDPSGANDVTTASVKASIRAGTPSGAPVVVDGFPNPTYTPVHDPELLPQPDDPSQWERRKFTELKGAMAELARTGSTVLELDIEDGPLLLATSMGTRLEFEVTFTHAGLFRKCRYGRGSARRASELPDIMRAAAPKG
jgi:hypothetical protein